MPHLSTLASKELYFQPIRARLEYKKAINQSYILSDYVNHNLSGLQNAIQFINNQTNNSSKALDNVLIISDFEDSPEENLELYKKLILLLSIPNISKIYYIIGS